MFSTDDEIIIAVTSFLLVIVATVSLANFVSERSCIQTTKVLGYKGQYSFFTGCIAEKDGNKILLEQLRYTKVEK